MPSATAFDFETQHFGKRAKIRIEKLLESLKDVRHYLNTHSLASDPKVGETLKQLFAKRLAKIEGLLSKFKKNITNNNDQQIKLSFSDQLTDIRLLIERFINNIKNDVCKKMPRRFALI